MHQIDNERFDNDEVLQDIKLNNPNIKAIFDEWTTFIFDRIDQIEKHYKLAYDEPSEGFGVTEEHRKDVMHRGDRHEGYPEHAKFIDLRPGHARLKSSEGAELIEEVEKKYHWFNETMCHELGSKRNALCVIYPKGGYVGWHNNANASAYNLICTYSTDGDGYWKHVNPKTKEIEEYPDVKGWQVKASYFGAYEERNPETLIYHTAQCTGGYRMTVSWIFDREHQDWWLDAIEELESD